VPEVLLVELSTTKVEFNPALNVAAVLHPPLGLAWAEEPVMEPQVVAPGAAQDKPPEPLFVSTPEALARPPRVERMVYAACFPLKVDQSAELRTPRFDAEAVGTLSVMTGVVVPVATVEDRSVPEVPSVSAATEVTVPRLLVYPEGLEAR
jgi:hypothetical protein